MKVTDFALKCSGVSRMGDNDKAVLVSFSRPLTDDELRFFHEVCQRSAPLMLVAVTDDEEDHTHD